MPRLGIACVLGAHVMWGLFPLYWRMLSGVSSIALTCHRIVWSFALLLTLTLLLPAMRDAIVRSLNRKTLTIYAWAALMIAINWLAFLYAVESERVLQASLGYYINPLFNLLLGVVVLKETLKPSQSLAAGLALVGVMIMAVAGDEVPWIALTMASTFAVYGLIKKKAPLGALQGLTLETGLLFPIATIYLLSFTSDEAATYQRLDWTLLVLGGAITVAPLALFAIAAQRVPLTVIGILQYVGPTLQWLVGVMVFDEPLGGVQIMGFSFVWLAVAVFLMGDQLSRSFASQPRSR